MHLSWKLVAFAEVVAVLLSFSNDCGAFLSLVSLRNRSGRISMGMHLTSAVVVGRAGGVAESIACKLLTQGITVTAVLDQKPLSPVLMQKASSTAGMAFYQDAEESDVFIECASQQRQTAQEALEKACSGRLLIVTDDDGDFDLRAQRLVKFQIEELKRKKKLGEDTGSSFIGPLAARLPPNISGVFCCTSAKLRRDANRGNLLQMFGATGTEAFSKFAEKSGKPNGALQYGELTGGVPGNEPVPFLGLPQLEPELHPSYVLQSVVCSPASSNQYASAELCTRDALAEVAVRAINQRADLSAARDCLVVSIPGAAMTEKDWDKLFMRLQASGNVELLRVEFQQVLKQKALVNWLVETWFPQALIDADAATVLRGARPVRATKTSDSTVRIAWEDLQPDLTVKAAGALEIAVVVPSTTTDGDVVAAVPYLAVRRLSEGNLAGEQQLMDKLVEAINKNVYKKQFCTPLSS